MRVSVKFYVSKYSVTCDSVIFYSRADVLALCLDIPCPGISHFPPKDSELKTC